MLHDRASRKRRCSYQHKRIAGQEVRPVTFRNAQVAFQKALKRSFNAPGGCCDGIKYSTRLSRRRSTSDAQQLTGPVTPRASPESRLQPSLVAATDASSSHWAGHEWTLARKATVKHVKKENYLIEHLTTTGASPLGEPVKAEAGHTAGAEGLEARLWGDTRERAATERLSCEVTTMRGRQHAAHAG